MVGVTCKYVNQAAWVKKPHPCGNHIKRGSLNDLCYFHVQAIIMAPTWNLWA